MQKFLISSFIFFYFFTFTTFSFAGTPDKELHQKCLYPAIYVGRADKESYGSGVIVRSEISGSRYKNVFLSCGHLEKDGYLDYEVKIFSYQNWSEVKQIKTYPAYFYAVNKDFDLAIGTFYSDEIMPVADIDFEPKIFIGNDVFRIGCGLGDEPRLDYGKLTQIKKDVPKQFIRTSIFTVPGDSGSPVYHENKLVAIMIQIRINHNTKQIISGISYAVPVERFKAWSKDNNNDLDFAWNKDKPLPKAPFIYLNIRDYEVKK